MTDVIKCCDFLGQAQWMAKRQHLHRNADFHAAGLRSDGASDQQRSGRDRSLREEVQFRDPDDVETPTISRLHLREGSHECLCIRYPGVAWKLVKDTELEWHPASPRGAIVAFVAGFMNNDKDSRYYASILEPLDKLCEN